MLSLYGRGVLMIDEMIRIRYSMSYMRFNMASAIN
jgi:hypothetical protein